MIRKNNNPTTRRDILRVTVAAAASVGAAGPGAKAAGPGEVTGRPCATASGSGRMPRARTSSNTACLEPLE